MELNKKSFALTAAIIYAACFFIGTLWVLIIGKPDGLEFVTSIYPGYSVSVLGAFIGLIYGFVEGLVFGFIFAWLYNKLLPAKTSQSEPV